jgi:4-hydroxy-tetrahydrodipicolinate reductase
MHTVTFDSAADTIELRHVAKNRTGFALGTMLAAEWIQGKKGMFTMEDVLQDLFGQK